MHLGFSRRNMFLLEQQYNVNAKIFSTVNLLISLLIQGGSLSLQIIVSCGIKFWQRLGEKVNFFNHQWWLQKQKQPSRGVPGKKCYENMQQIYRRTPMPKCGFNKAANQLYWNHTSAWVFSCKFTVYFQNTFL